MIFIKIKTCLFDVFFLIEIMNYDINNFNQGLCYKLGVHNILINFFVWVTHSGISLL